MNVYLRVLITTVSVSAIAVSFPYVVSYGAITGIKAGLEFGVISGLVMTAAMAMFQEVSLRGENVKASTVAPKQTAEVCKTCDLDTAIDECMSALNAFGITISEVDRESGSIEGISQTTIRSWGEVISLNLSKIGENEVRIRIHSSPKMRTTLIDYGKGYRNVQKLRELIAK